MDDGMDAGCPAVVKMGGVLCLHSGAVVRPFYVITFAGIFFCFICSFMR